MIDNFYDTTNMNWGTIGSFNHINEELINMIEGFDFEYAEYLRKKLI